MGNTRFKSYGKALACLCEAAVRDFDLSVPPEVLGQRLIERVVHADVSVRPDTLEMVVHRIILEADSPVQALKMAWPALETLTGLDEWQSPEACLQSVYHRYGLRTKADRETAPAGLLAELEAIADKLEDDRRELVKQELEAADLLALRDLLDAAVRLYRTSPWPAIAAHRHLLAYSALDGENWLEVRLKSRPSESCRVHCRLAGYPRTQSRIFLLGVLDALADVTS